jgi:hypothetical protein
MNERGWIEPIVERVVRQVLDTQVAQLRIEIVRRVMDEIAAAPAPDGTAAAEPARGQHTTSTADSAGLARAVAEIQLGASQRDILRALLDTSSRYATRVALFVVKGARATGWQGRGFANSEAVKDFGLEETTPAIVCAIRDRVLTSASADAIGQVQILPLILKDKVAALLYADSGTNAAGLLDIGSLELLVLATSAWLEVNSLRKQAQKELSLAQLDGQNAAAAEAHPGAAAHATSAFSDPFASSSPHHAMAAAASAGETSASIAGEAMETPTLAASSPETVAADGMSAQSAHLAFQSAAVATDPAFPGAMPLGHAETAPTSAAPSTGALSPEDQDVHRKAQRFARLLVDEIKLYNQAKVAEGRNNKDLYDRLKEVIEKSRITYQKRYGITVAASGNYFQHEIIRSLAEDDLSIMGANFRH